MDEQLNTEQLFQNGFDQIGQGFGSIGEGTKSFMKDRISETGEAIQDGFNTAGETLKTAADNFMKDMDEKSGGKISEFNENMKGMGENIKGFADGAGKYFQGVGESGSEFFSAGKNMLNALSGGMLLNNPLVNKFKEVQAQTNINYGQSIGPEVSNSFNNQTPELDRFDSIKFSQNDLTQQIPNASSIQDAMQRFAEPNANENLLSPAIVEKQSEIIREEVDTSLLPSQEDLSVSTPEYMV